MHKTGTPKGQFYETEAYNSGWLAGYDSFVVELFEGFQEEIPKWLLSLIGGKKVVAEALRSKEMEGFDGPDWEADYECGTSEGYEELLLEIKEAYEQKETEMPKFLQQITSCRSG